ncbi:polyphosphate kinase 2 family protein [Mongoliitalea daihaiensis]|uniref:polyphosphate kinase 2 n=1 Tax=Mongoliitalea daihaiensis TaxID=2782006 RepID=UPI001F2C8B7F|nr:polyphosphate kinase 2 [Mongoliitalea daihaiensis]
MSKVELSEEDLEVLNTKVGLKHLLASKKVDLGKALQAAKAEIRLREIKAELVKLQLWLIKHEKKLILLFHGGVSIEKSGIIRNILSHNNPRHYRIEVNLPHLSNPETGEWYFKKFVEKLPQPGEMVFWDRSWYNRALIEPIHGLCSAEEYDLFMKQVNGFEQMLVDSGYHLVKFYFTVGKKEQQKRMAEIQHDPLAKWKLLPLDYESYDLWEKYQEYKSAMFEHTDTPYAPWMEIAVEKRQDEIALAAQHLLSLFPYREG